MPARLAVVVTSKDAPTRFQTLPSGSEQAVAAGGAHSRWESVTASAGSPRHTPILR